MDCGGSFRRHRRVGAERDLEARRRQAFEAGEAAMQRGQWAEAEKNFLEIVAITPGDTGAHANLGVIYMRQQKWKRALDELHAAETWLRKFRNPSQHRPGLLSPGRISQRRSRLSNPCCAISRIPRKPDICWACATCSTNATRTPSLTWSHCGLPRTAI